MQVTRTNNCDDSVTSHDLTEAELLQMVQDDKHAAALFLVQQGHRWAVTLVADGGDKIAITRDQSGPQLIVYDIPSRRRKYKFDETKLTHVLRQASFTPRQDAQLDSEFLDNNQDLAVSLLEALVPVLP